MSRTPAAHLARLKVTYPAWQITRHGNGTIRATRLKDRGTAQVLVAAVPSELEELLEEAGR